MGDARTDRCLTCARLLEYNVPLAEVAAARAVTDRYVADLCVSGVLPAERFGTVWRVREDWRGWVALRSSETIDERRKRLEDGKARKRKAAAAARIRIAQQDAAKAHVS
jgi:hypothetical protein